jgi:hypothetical protein
VRSAIITRGWQKPRSRIELSTPVWWHSPRCLHSELDWAVGLVNHLRGSEPSHGIPLVDRCGPSSPRCSGNVLSRRPPVPYTVLHRDPTHVLTGVT